MASCRVLNQIPQELIDWRDNMPLEVEKLFNYVGHLPSLLNITPNMAIIRALLKYWDPECSVFRFGECELTLTVEEIEGLLQAPGKGHPALYPSNGTKDQFCKFLGLKHKSMNQHPDARSCSLDFLYKRFGRRDSFERYRADFFITEDQWKGKRFEAFGLALINLLLFPQRHGKVTVSTIHMIQNLFLGIKGKTPTLVPIIIADIFTAATECQRKGGFFHASNLILQMWAMEHLARRTLKSLGPCLSTENWIASHRERVLKYYRVASASQFMQEFEELTPNKVQWVLDWTKVSDPAFKTTKHSFIPLASVNGLVDYIPQRVMRQFGYPQRVPLVQEVKRIRLCTVVQSRDMVLEAWGNLQSLEDLHLGQVNKLEPKSTPEYDEWIKQKVAQEMERSQPIPFSPEEHIEKLKMEVENHQLQLILADHTLENVKSQLGKEVKKNEKLERTLDALDKIQEGIRKLSIGSPKESQRTRLARHEDFVRMVSQVINDALKNN